MICTAFVVLSVLRALGSPLVIKQCCVPVRVSPKPYKIQLLVSVLSTGFFFFSVKLKGGIFKNEHSDNHK